MGREMVVCLLLLAGSLHSLFAQAAADAVLLSHRTVVTLKGRTLRTEVGNRIQINNRKGDKYATVAVPFSKILKVSDLQAHITDSDGNVVAKLKPSAIRKRSLLTDEAFFQDAMELEFSLTSPRYPYVLHYSYVSQQTDFMHLTRWIPVLDTGIETRSAQLSLQVPVDCKLRYAMNQIGPPDIDEQEGIRTYTWNTRFNGEVEGELYSPPLISFVPGLWVVPLRFNYTSPGSFHSWKSYGSWQYAVNDKLQQLPAAEIQTVRSLVSGITDTLEMVRAVYHYLQDHTRYVNISIENGGLIPVAAHRVAINKYGDCKGLSNYMMALLRAVGIRSHYADVHAGNPINYINDTLPAQQFNHVILAVPLSGDTLWLDCTSKGPFNYAGTFIQHRPALLIDKEESKLVTIPALTKADVHSARTITIGCDTNTVNRLEVDCRYRGADFETISSIDRNVPVADKARVLHDYFGVKSSVSENFQVGFSHRDSAFATLKFTARSRQYIKKVAGEWHISSIPFAIPPFRKPSSRQLPVQIDVPLCFTDTQIFEIPGVVSPVKDAIADIEFTSHAGNYCRKTVVDSSGKLLIYKKFELNAGFYSQQQYPGLYDFIRRVTEAENTLLVLSANRNVL